MTEVGSRQVHSDIMADLRKVYIGKPFTLSLDTRVVVEAQAYTHTQAHANALTHTHIHSQGDKSQM